MSLRVELYNVSTFVFLLVREAMFSNITTDEKKDYFLLLASQYIVFFCLIFVRDISSSFELFYGVIVLLLFFIDVVYLLRHSLLLSALAPSALFGLCFGLYLLRLDISIDKMDSFFVAVLIFAIAIWSFAALGLLKSKNCKMVKKQNDLSSRIYKSCIVVLFIISASAMLSEWIYAGGVPALRSDAETFRFSVSYNTYVHIVAIALKFVPAFCAIAYVYFGKKWMRSNRSIYLIAIVSLILLLGTALRGEFLCGVILPLFVLFAYSKIHIKYIVIAGVLIVVVLDLYPILRTYGLYGMQYINNMSSISVIPSLWFLTPLYETFSYNLHIFNKLTMTFPQLVDFGYSQYTLLSYIPFVELGAPLGQVQNAVWGLNFYGALVSTAFGPWYADYGVCGVIIFAFLLGAISAMIQNAFAKNGTPVWALFYAYFLYNCFMVSYANTFDQVFIFYSFMIAIIMLISRKAIRN